MFRFLFSSAKLTPSTKLIQSTQRGLKYLIQPLESSVNEEQKIFQITTDENAKNAVEALKKIQPKLNQQQFFTKLHGEDTDKPYLLAKRLPLKDEEVIQTVCNEETKSRPPSR